MRHTHSIMNMPLHISQQFVMAVTHEDLRHFPSSPPDEEPEEDLTIEQLEEKAKAGDARAQTRVTESTYIKNATWHCFLSCCMTQSGWEQVSIFYLWDQTWNMIHKLLSHIQIIESTITAYCSMHWICANNHEIFSFSLLLILCQPVQMCWHKKSGGLAVRGWKMRPDFTFKTRQLWKGKFSSDQ